MGQRDVLIFLYKKKFSEDRYYTIAEISKGIGMNKNITSKAVNKLWYYGYLMRRRRKELSSRKNNSLWGCKFKLKVKYMLTVKRMAKSVNNI